MNKKCIGCGVLLQTEREEELGYIVDTEKKLCTRCFRIKHYKEYKKVAKTKEEYESILEEIDQKKDLIVFMVDLFLWNKDFVEVCRKLESPILLVLSKRDVMPLSLNDEKIIEYIEDLKLPIIDMEIISSYKNFNLDALFEKIKNYQKSPYVYVVGFTNVGKSTLMNKMIYNYSKNTSEIITSIMPSTTIDSIEVNLSEDLILVDTPGLLSSKNIMNDVEGKMLSKIIPNKEIKPLTYQVKTRQYIYIEDFLEIEIENKNNVTLYMSNRLQIERVYKKKKEFPYTQNIQAYKGEDIVIEGLGFMKATHAGTFTFHSAYELSIYTRKSMIG